MSQSSPNVLLIMADQLTAFATGPYGNDEVLTPHLDALAQRGVVFENAYCNAPLCVPSRAALMSGRLPSGVPCNDNAEEFPATVPTFAHSLRRAGYRTILSGKMHFVGPDQLHGFEERLTTDIFPAGLTWTRPWADQGDPPRLSGEQQNNGREYVDILQASGPLEWTYQMHYDEEVKHQTLQRLRELTVDRSARASQPWLMVTSFTQPHDPYVAPAEYWDRYEHRDISQPTPTPEGYQPHTLDTWANSYHGVDRVPITAKQTYRARRGYYAMTSYIDDAVGEIVAELDRLGLSDDTVIVFTSDHGDQLGEHGMFFKRTLREWSTRVPLIVAGPSVAQGARVSTRVSLVDLHPTLAELAETKLPDDVSEPLAGSSLAKLLRGEEPGAVPDEAVIENLAEGTITVVRALISGRYKLIYARDLPDQLYDLDTDPDEWRNLADDPAHVHVLRHLRKQLLDNWDPDEAQRTIEASQQLRRFLSEAMAQGQHTAWDYQPHADAWAKWVRGTGDDPWDPLCGF